MVEFWESVCAKLIQNKSDTYSEREKTHKFVLRCLSEYAGESNQMNDIVQLDLASISSSLRKRWDNMTAAKVASTTKEVTSITTWVTSSSTTQIAVLYQNNNRLFCVCYSSYSAGFFLNFTRSQYIYTLNAPLRTLITNNRPLLYYHYYYFFFCWRFHSVVFCQSTSLVMLSSSTGEQQRDDATFSISYLIVTWWYNIWRG